MFDVRARTILFVIAGSRSYGLHTENSDVDVKGVCIPPIPPYKIGILDSFEQAESQQHLSTFFDLLTKEEQDVTLLECAGQEYKTAADGVIYDIAKFFKLALNANPNILEVLFCDDQDIRFITPAGEKLREARDLFLSKKVVWSYQGYAFSQMKRIKNHRSFLLNPAQKPPKREDFGLPPDRSLLSGDEQNAFLWVLAEILKDKVSEFRLTEETRAELQDKIDVFGAIQSGVPDHVWPTIKDITGATTEFIQVMQAERKYKSARASWKSYQSWIKNRNPERAAIEKKCGFDGKHGLHLARLMKQGKQILQEGTLRVRLTKEDREWLMQIREGHFPFEELEEWFEREQTEMKEAVEISSLPKKPNRKKADELLISLQMDAMKESG